eukprot:COSAG02_NODE_2620_length_8412_cov_5.573459_6_plen_394_part_00
MACGVVATASDSDGVKGSLKRGVVGSGMASPAKREAAAMERLQKEALKLEKMRAKEHAELMELDREEAAQEKHLQMEARRRYEMDRQRKRYQEQEDRMHEMIDAQMDRQQRVAERMKAEKERKQQEIKEKQQKYKAKIDAIADARKKTMEEELKKAEAIESRMASPRKTSSPRRGVTPRGTSPRRRKDLGASTDSIGSHARHEVMANRRLEEEKQALMKRIEREKEKLERIAKEKEARKAKAAQRRKAARPVTRPSGEELSHESMADEDAPGTGAESSKQKLNPARRAAQSPRRTPRRAPPKPEPLTQEEAERLGFIKKQRCAVCTREYTLENLPSVVSYRAVEVLRENWSAQFGTTAVKDARYAAATKLYDQVRVCVFCFQHFDPDEDEPTF